MKRCLHASDEREDRDDNTGSSIWMSRNKDIMFETSCDPLDPRSDGYCHYFGLHGCADKAIAMMDYLCDEEGVRDPETIWAEAVYYREWM